MSDDHDLAALEGWASNPAVPIEERLAAALEVIRHLRDKDKHETPKHRTLTGFHFVRRVNTDAGPFKVEIEITDGTVTLVWPNYRLQLTAENAHQYGFESVYQDTSVNDTLRVEDIVAVRRPDEERCE